MSAPAGSTYREVFASANLHRIYNEHIATSSAIGIDRINRPTFEKMIRSEIALIRRKSANSTYRFSQYKEKLVSKGAGRPPRIISIATFRDRITLRALCDFLRARFEDQLNLQIPQVVVHRLKKEIATGKYTSFIKLDVRDFYPSISHAILRAHVTTRLKSSRRVKGSGCRGRSPGPGRFEPAGGNFPASVRLPGGVKGECCVLPLRR